MQMAVKHEPYDLACQCYTCFYLTHKANQDCCCIQCATAEEAELLDAGDILEELRTKKRYRVTDTKPDLLVQPLPAAGDNDKLCVTKLLGGALLLPKGGFLRLYRHEQSECIFEMDDD